MVRLPDGFVATKFPGYFWNIPEQKLYSIKIGGVLKPMKLKRAENVNFFARVNGRVARWHTDGYHVSVNGIRRVLFVDYLEKLTEDNSIIPLKE